MTKPTIESVIERLEKMPDQLDNRNRILGLHPFDTMPAGIRAVLDDLRSLRDEQVASDTYAAHELIGQTQIDERRRALDILRSLRPDAAEVDESVFIDRAEAYMAGFDHAREKAAGVIEHGAEAWKAVGEER